MRGGICKLVQTWAPKASKIPLIITKKEPNNLCNWFFAGLRDNMPSSLVVTVHESDSDISEYLNLIHEQFVWCRTRKASFSNSQQGIQEATWIHGTLSLEVLWSPLRHSLPALLLLAWWCSGLPSWVSLGTHRAASILAALGQVPNSAPSSCKARDAVQHLTWGPGAGEPAAQGRFAAQGQQMKTVCVADLGSQGPS